MKARKIALVTLTAGAMIVSSVGFAAADGRGDAGAAAKAHIFTDLQMAPWAQSAVLEMAFQGIVKGEGKHTFSPNSPVTMSQLATILARF